MTGDAPVAPNGMLRGTWICSALTKHKTNRHWRNATTTSATMILFAILDSEPPAPQRRVTPTG
jgi:hypothetical protein